MEIIISMLALILFTVSDAMSDAWMFRDFRNCQRDLEANKRWHRWQFVRQSALILTVAFFAGKWQLVIFGASLFWVIHDGIVNIIGLQKPFFYVGQTAAIDKFFRRFNQPELMMAIAKIIMVAVSVTLYFIFK